jgi:hypothetical protein
MSVAPIKACNKVDHLVAQGGKRRGGIDHDWYKRGADGLLKPGAHKLALRGCELLLIQYENILMRELFQYLMINAFEFVLLCEYSFREGWFQP